MHTCYPPHAFIWKQITKKSAKKGNLVVWRNPLKIGKMQTPQGKKTSWEKDPRVFKVLGNAKID
jgi:hypothetical protein